MERSSKRIRVEDDAADSIFVEETKDIREDGRFAERRNILLQYRAIEVRINEGKDDFMSIMNEVENMHQHVKKPKEQVADAEALLGLTNTLVCSVKTHLSGDITAAQFVSSLLGEFGKQKYLLKDTCIVVWKSIGSLAASIFMSAPVCKTMIGAMRIEVKQRKSVFSTESRIGSSWTEVHPQGVCWSSPHSLPRKRSSWAKANAHPQELEMALDVVANTDKTIHAMFEMLKKKKKVKLENLMLNRNSFAQTVENLFALSFLVKDGRVRIDVDDSGSQEVAPTNGPSAEEIKIGVAKTHQFIFRYDFDDWKLMKNTVLEGELMPSRHAYYNASFSKAKTIAYDKRSTVAEAIPEGIPIGSKLFNQAPVMKKLPRNYGVTVAKY